MQRLVRQPPLLKRAVGGDVHYRHAIVLVEHIVKITLQRREPELLCIIYFDTSTNADGVGLEPVFRQRPRISV